MRSRYRALYLHIILILVAFFCGNLVFAGASPLLQKISLDIQDEPIQSILKTIESQAGVKIMYNSQILADKKPVTIKIADVTVKRALQLILNDAGILFYEHDQYIVITRRQLVPHGVQFEKAIVETPRLIQIAINDTLVVYDTIAIPDTFRVAVSDTVRVFDTISVSASDVKVKRKKPSQWAVGAECMPAFHTSLGDKQSVGQLSFSVQTFLIYEQKNWSFGAGIGTLLQRGATKQEFAQQSTDSVLRQSSKTEVHRYETGRYYFVDGVGETVMQILYDSTKVTIPYEWYEKEHKTTTVSQTISHQIMWLSLPLRLAYHTASKQKFNAGVSLTISPTLAIHSGGQFRLNDDASVSTSLSVATYAIYIAFAPSVSYKLNNKAQLVVMPTIQSSTMSYVHDASYVSFYAGLAVGTIFSLGN